MQWVICNNPNDYFSWEPEKINVKFQKMTSFTRNLQNFTSFYNSSEIWNSSSRLIYGYRNNFRFPFSYLLTLWLSASQDAGGYTISRRNILELHLGCHTCWLSYFTLVCLWFGRTVGRAYGHVISKISRMGRLTHFFRYGATLWRASRGRA